MLCHLSAVDRAVLFFGCAVVQEGALEGDINGVL